MNGPPILDQPALPDQLRAGAVAGAAPAPPTGPIPIQALLAGGHLRCSDIMLTRNEYHPMSWLIRVATDANFAHAGLVFLRPEPGEGWRSTFLIESVFGGVDVTDLADYFAYPRLSVAIKRLERPWFGDRLQRRVRARMLDEIDAEYDYSTMFRLGRNALFGVQRMVLGHKRALGRRMAKELTPPKEFICTGFIQRGFAATVGEEIARGVLPPEALADVVFDRAVREVLPAPHALVSGDRNMSPPEVLRRLEPELLAVTPRDIELAEAFRWVWVLKGDMAHPVSSYGEVCELLRMRPVGD